MRTPTPGTPTSTCAIEGAGANESIAAAVAAAITYFILLLPCLLPTKNNVQQRLLFRVQCHFTLAIDDFAAATYRGAVGTNRKNRIPVRHPRNLAERRRVKLSDHQR